MKVYCEQVKTPAGLLQVAATGEAIVAISFEKSIKTVLEKIVKHSPQPLSLMKEGNAVTKKAVTELKEYFAGTRSEFTVPLKLFGTEFQKKSWKTLLRIPFGNTVSYGKQAKMLGKPNASRAVGSANGKNPICIIIPCHRVVAGNGGIGGYTGGIEKKKILLKIEGVSDLKI